MRLEGSPYGRRNAKRLRREMTPPEIGLWLALRDNTENLRFRKQHGAGNYVLDFYCAPVRLVIEVDGEAHERGDRPSEMLRAMPGSRYAVSMLRYPAQEVLTNLEGVVQQILVVAIERQRSKGRIANLPLRHVCGMPPPPGGRGLPQY